MECPKCTFQNKADVGICEICQYSFHDKDTKKALDIELLNIALKDIENERLIEENYKAAYDVIPESFFQVEMLYFNCKINNVPIKAFVDTGAQMTIMSEKIAKKCGVDYLIDKKYKGTAIGVGRQKIKGKIHLLDITIDEKGTSLPCSFTILNCGENNDIIFGLDMLKSHGIVLDLKKKCMYINDLKIDFI